MRVAFCFSLGRWCCLCVQDVKMLRKMCVLHSAMGIYFLMFQPVNMCVLARPCSRRALSGCSIVCLYMSNHLTGPPLPRRD